MEAYGLRVSEESLQFFPFAVEIPIGEVWYWHMATFFYEFCWDILVFALLLVIRRCCRRKGDVFCWYLLLYCAGRTVIEGLRNDSLTFKFQRPLGENPRLHGAWRMNPGYNVPCDCMRISMLSFYNVPIEKE